MAFTTENVDTGDGSKTDFSFTFPYINESDVKVTITDANGDPQPNTAFTFANATTLSFTSAPLNGRTVRIFRDTNLDNAEVTFFAGSAIRAEDLNDNQNQVLFSAQEVENNAILLTGGTMTGPLVLDDTTLQIQEGSDTLTIDAPALSANRTVSFTDVSGNVVTTGDIGTVTRTMLADSAINAGKLADDSVDSQHYVAGSIDLEHMSANSVDSDQYVDGSIDRVHLAADVIDGTKIEDDAVNSEHIAAGAVDLEHMSANSVDSDQYVDGSIDLIHMSANSVDSDQYVDGSIDGVHIADDAIDSQHYAAGSIDNEHLANNSVDSDQLVNGSVDLAHMSANSVDSDQYVDGSIDLIHMSANSVDSDQYVDGSIDEAHLADGAVTSTKIADDTIVNADIKSDAAIAGSKINMSLNQLSDVNVGTPGSNQDNQVLAWDNGNSEFSLTTVSSGGGGISDIVEDSSPQLGGMLDVNGNSIGDGTLELLSFSETASAVNEFTIANAATGNDPVLSATGGDANIGITINPKGTGDINLDAGTHIDGTLTFDSGHQIITSTALQIASDTSRLQVNKGSSNQPALDLMVDATRVVRIQTPTSLTGNTSYTLTLPQNDGDANQFLQTDGSGTLSFATVDTSGASTQNIAVNTPTTIDSFTIASNRNVGMMGELTVNDGETITIGSGSKLVILN